MTSDVIIYLSCIGYSFGSGWDYKEPHKKYLGKLYMEKNNTDISYAIITINNSHISPNPNYLYRKNKNLPYRR